MLLGRTPLSVELLRRPLRQTNHRSAYPSAVDPSPLFSEPILRRVDPSPPFGRSVSGRFTVRPNLFSLDFQQMEALPKIMKLKPIDATPMSFAAFGQVISASPDGQEYSSDDASLELNRGIPRGKWAPSTSNLHDHFLSLLGRCTTLNHLKQLQAFILKLGHGQTQIYSFKLTRFAVLTLAELRYARRIFDSLASPNVFLYTVMLTAYASHSDSDSALRLFNLMLRRAQAPPNEFIYPHLLRACSYQSNLNLVKSVHSLIEKTGFDEFGVVQTSLIYAYSRFSNLDTARTLFDGMFERNVISWTALISGYARVGEIKKAIALFEKMPEKDVPSWNAIISGCTQNGHFSEAVGHFQRMVLEGTRPNQTTASCVLSACGHLGMLGLGKWVHVYVCKNHMGFNPFVTNALIDMYGKCGSMREARHVFMSLSDKCLTAWNSMINCLALHGYSESALVTFKEMEIEGPKPDEVTFVGLLNACTHGGLVDEGLNYFKSMVQCYKIEPTIEHYGCVIDLLSRAGRFEEAMDIVRDMRVDPDEVVWGSLLNGCRIYKCNELAEFAIRKLQDIEPNNADYGVMVANLYSECGKWEDVGNVRKMLKEFGGKKLPGCSWIEIESKLHRFNSTDVIHPEARQIYEVLEALIGQMEAY